MERSSRDGVEARRWEAGLKWRCTKGWLSNTIGSEQSEMVVLRVLLCVPPDLPPTEQGTGHFLHLEIMLRLWELRNDLVSGKQYDDLDH